MGPKKIIEDLISTARSSGTSVLFIVDESTVTTLSSKVTLQPIFLKISSILSTSLNFGQFFITLIPSFKTVAANIGKTAFFDPSCNYKVYYYFMRGLQKCYFITYVKELIAMFSNSVRMIV